MSLCPPREQLAALLNDELSDADRADVTTHLDSCGSCQHLLESLRGTVEFQSNETAAQGAKIDETIEASQSMMRTAAETAAKQSLPANLNVPGYKMLDELGRGGMGVVYKAKQLSLDRLVALKMIRSAAIAGPDQLARFNTEAESLAQLQHPNIVQVFEIGRHDDMPYLSMEFVAGETLEGAIQNEWFGFSESAQLVEKLSRAMFSAHQRGVLHRDLKPANVLLAEDREPKITDFGLAKRVSSDSQLTADATVMGTPSYMPPEQAQGRITDIGPRSDVYSLGAILYELLTGRPPFRSGSPLETIQQVIQREPAAPRSLNKKVPRDLETICLKCLHKQPAQRYETAADLADDLRRFDRGEPILARRIGLAGRGWRWCRRNKALAAALAATFLAVLVGASGVAWQSRQTEQQRARVQQQFVRFAAESDEKLQLIQDLMERVPEDQQAQDERLQSALASYESWLAEEPSDAAAQENYAQALFRVAEIRRRIGQFDIAEQAYLKAKDVYQRLAETSLDSGHSHGLTETLNWLGESYRESGQIEMAIATYEEAMAVQEGLANRAPDEPLYRSDVARSLYNRGLALRALSRPEEAETDLRKSIELLEQCLQERSEDPRFRQGLARSRANLGILLRATNRAVDAHQQYLIAIDLLRGLQQEFSRSPEYRIELATFLMNHANLLFLDRQTKSLGVDDPLTEAERTYESSVEILEALADEFSNVPRYRKELANSLNGLGAVRSQSGDGARAEQAWTDAVDEFKTLVARSPKVAEYHGLLAQTTHNLAYLHRNDEDPSELRALLSEAVDRQRKAIELSPKNVLYARSLHSYERTLARVLVDAGEHAKAGVIAERLATSSNGDLKTLYAAAKILAQCANAAESDESLRDDPATELAFAYRARAATLLSTCREQGVSIRASDFPGMTLAD
jgi:tetratricopeptide (TPR) repeat protein